MPLLGYFSIVAPVLMVGLYAVGEALETPGPSALSRDTPKVAQPVQPIRPSVPILTMRQGVAPPQSAVATAEPAGAQSQDVAARSGQAERPRAAEPRQTARAAQADRTRRTTRPVDSEPSSRYSRSFDRDVDRAFGQVRTAQQPQQRRLTRQTRSFMAYERHHRIW